MAPGSSRSCADAQPIAADGAGARLAARLGSSMHAAPVSQWPRVRALRAAHRSKFKPKAQMSKRVSAQIAAGAGSGKIMPVFKHRKCEAPAVGSIAKVRFQEWLNGPKGSEWRAAREERLRVGREDCQ